MNDEYDYSVTLEDVSKAADHGFLHALAQHSQTLNAHRTPGGLLRRLGRFIIRKQGGASTRAIVTERIINQFPRWTALDREDRIIQHMGNVLSTLQGLDPVPSAKAADQFLDIVWAMQGTVTPQSASHRFLMEAAVCTLAHACQDERILQMENVIKGVGLARKASGKGLSDYGITGLILACAQNPYAGDAVMDLVADKIIERFHGTPQQMTGLLESISHMITLDLLKPADEKPLVGTVERPDGTYRITMAARDKDTPATTSQVLKPQGLFITHYEAPTRPTMIAVDSPSGQTSYVCGAFKGGVAGFLAADDESFPSKDARESFAQMAQSLGQQKGTDQPIPLPPLAHALKERINQSQTRALVLHLHR